MAREQARGHDHPRRGIPDDASEPAGTRPPGSDEGTEDEAADAPGEAPLRLRDDLAEAGGEQAEFREQFDEDLYNDREDRPAQGNTADVAMEHRFGSDADAYSEYAWRRPGDHHRGDESAVGQSRDPADIADEDDSP